MMMMVVVMMRVKVLDDGCDGCDDGEDKMMMVTVLTMHIVFGESKLLTLQLLVLSKHDPLTLSFTALSL